MKIDKNTLDGIKSLLDHAKNHAGDWDYAEWLTNRILEDVRDHPEGGIGYLKAGYRINNLVSHIRQCAEAERGMMSTVLGLYERSREEKEEEE